LVTGISEDLSGHIVEMEHPVKDVKDVVRALVDFPTLKRQEDTLREYFTSDVEFYHPYLNLNRGLEALIAIFNLAQLILNYSGVDFHTIVYDGVTNCIDLRMTVYIKPWAFLKLRTIPLRFNTLLELSDVIVDGNTLKKIKVQRDYFIRSPLLQLIPVFGEIYDSENLRFFLGDTQAFIFLFVKSLVFWILRHLPPKVWHNWLGLSIQDIAVHEHL
jgi:hypothetical protein